jgi:uncharacterized membrane protein
MNMATKGSGKKGANQKRNRADKKMSQEEFDKTKRAEDEMKIIMGVIIAFVIIVVLALIFSISSPENTSDYSTPYDIVGDELLIPVSDVSTSAQYYKYETGGKDVKFFSVLGSDGGIHTAFDACDVCYQEKKGYAQKGSKMECRNCGNQYSTNQIGTANQGGGCWPGYMQRTVSDGFVRIKLSELDTGRRYFP